MKIALSIEGIQALLQPYCEEHIEVRHGNDGATAFVRLESHDHAINARNKLGQNLVVVLGFPGRAAGAQDPGKIKRDLVLRFASYAGSVADGATGRITAMRSAERIMFDFLARLRTEQLQDPECGQLSDLDLDNFRFEEIEDQPWFLNHYGYDLVVPFRTSVPKYDASRWTSGGENNGGLNNALNFTGLNFTSENGAMVFAGGIQGDYLTQVSVHNPLTPELGYINAEGIGVSLGAFSGDTTTAEYLTPGEVLVKWRRVQPVPPYTPVSGYQQATITVSRLSTRWYKLYRVADGNRFFLYPGFGSASVYDAAGIIGFTATSADDLVAKWNNHPANAGFVISQYRTLNGFLEFLVVPAADKTAFPFLDIKCEI